MNAYDHHDHQRYLERNEAQRLKSIAERRAALERRSSEPEAGRLDRPWQASFLLRLTLHVAFYGWVLWWLAGMPQIPIRWLQ